MPRKRRHFQDAMVPAPRVRQSLEESLRQAGIYEIMYPDIILYENGLLSQEGFRTAIAEASSLSKLSSTKKKIFQDEMDLAHRKVELDMKRDLVKGIFSFVR